MSVLFPSPPGMGRGTGRGCRFKPASEFAGQQSTRWGRRRRRVFSPVVFSLGREKIIVNPGESIQAAIDRAHGGDRVEVLPGVYHQALMVDKPGISLIGVQVNGERPILDGQNKLGDAIQGSGDYFLAQGFSIRNYTGNGVVNNRARHVTYRDLVVENPGLYAIYPVECSDVLVEGCVVSGAKDAGIYVGQSRDIIVRNNEVFHNVAGIEIENSVRALVVNNSAHHNTGGILVFLLPSNPSKVASHTRVINNRCFENNHENFGKPGSTVSTIPPGLGMLIMAADHTEVTQNEIFGNDSQGIQLISYLTSQVAPKKKIELDIEPNADNNLIHGNTYHDNGRHPAKTYVDQNIPGGDLAWDGTGMGNGWQEESGVKTFLRTCPSNPGWSACSCRWRIKSPIFISQPRFLGHIGQVWENDVRRGSAPSSFCFRTI